jgi:hypothetical protein
MYLQFIKYLNNIKYNDPLEDEVNLLLCLKLIENSKLEDYSIIYDIKNSKLTNCDKLKLYNHIISYHNYSMIKEDKKNCLYNKSKITIKSKL